MADQIHNVSLYFQEVDDSKFFFPADFAKEISTRTQPLQQALDHLSKQQQPLIDVIRELPKKLDDIRQSQSSSNLIKEFSSKLDPLTQSIKAIKDGLDKQTLTDPQKQSDHNQDIEKALQPFSHIIKTLKDSIEQSQAQQQSETKKFDNLEQRISKSFDTTPKPSDIMGKLNEITTNFKQTDPTIKKLSDDLNTIKTLIEKQTTPALHQASKDVILCTISHSTILLILVTRFKKN
jgi:DNA repair exonuclease SbcCD ATPase subunit